jgi:hypothetical protein
MDQGSDDTRDFVGDASDPLREHLVLNQVALGESPQVIFFGMLHGRCWPNPKREDASVAAAMWGQADSFER